MRGSYVKRCSENVGWTCIVMLQSRQARDWIGIDICENRTVVGEHCQAKCTSCDSSILSQNVSITSWRNSRKKESIFRASLNDEVRSTETRILLSSNFLRKTNFCRQERDEILEMQIILDKMHFMVLRLVPSDAKVLYFVAYNRQDKRVPKLDVNYSRVASLRY